MAKKQFKAESKKLLDMMINSIYTHNEIFLRELISNASDALDKRYYKSLESGDTGINRKDFYIELNPDKEAGTLTISDNGIGMTAEELEDNLGTIAQSGSLAFKQEFQKKHDQKADGEEKETDAETASGDTDIIGQFGVGFYSAFMVADHITVTSLAEGGETAYVWESDGADGYEISEGVKDSVGTDIVLHMKKDENGENYSQYLDEFTIRMLIKRYSDYIHYPIRMMVTKSRPKKTEEPAEGEQKDEKKTPEYETFQEMETLNSMEPIWKRARKDVKDEEYNEYYKSKFSDYQDPCRVIRTSVEGMTSYTALLFLPSHVPFDYYTKDYEKGLQLYSSGVMIMDKCKDLLPDYFNFVRGLVDSQDLSLNISRETLQEDRQLRAIAKNLEKKIKRELVQFMKDDREGYEKFWENFGRNIKYGLYEGYGMHRDLLADLVLFYSSMEKKMVTLDEYIAKMGEEQKYIYYAPGETIEKIDMLPQTKAAKAKGYEILYLTEDVDEFVVKMMGSYKDKEFRSISEENMNEETDEQKKASEEKAKANKDLLDFMKKTLGDSVAEVKLSALLDQAPVTLTSRGGVSIEMEKTLNRMPVNQGVKAQRVLELNPDHEVFGKLCSTFEAEKDQEEKPMTAACTRLLYAQASLISGLEVEDPVQLSEDINKLILK